MTPRSPHNERAAVAAEVADRLRHRGIVVSSGDAPDAIADLLSAVERFEAVVEAHGGDLMVDDLNSSRPDDQHFVLPRRAAGESVVAYVNRIDAATNALGKHPRHAD